MCCTRSDVMNTHAIALLHATQRVKNTPALGVTKSVEELVLSQHLPESDHVSSANPVWRTSRA